LFDMHPTSVLHRAVLHIRYWADTRLSAKCRLLISDRDKKPMSDRCGNVRRLDIGPIWLFDMQPTSVRHRAVLHIRYRSDMRTRYKVFAGYLHNFLWIWLYGYEWPKEISVQYLHVFSYADQDHDAD